VGDAKLGLARLKGMGLVGEVAVGSGDPEVLKEEAIWEEHDRKSKRKVERFLEGF
jgi:hypothetical protein